MITFSNQTLEMDKLLDPSISNIMKWPDTAAHTNLTDEVKWFTHPYF